MLAALSALTVMAAGLPKVTYKAEAASPTDVGSVILSPPVNTNCFEAVLASLIQSSRKSDRAENLYLSVTLAASNGAPSQITGANWGEAKPMKLVNLRVGDVACHEYVCPTGSTAIFAVDPEAKAAILAGGATVKVASTIGSSCDLALALAPPPIQALDRWAAGLSKPK